MTAVELDLHDGGISRPDDHAPISLMGDHVHHQGELMLSYRYMLMYMNGNRDRTEDLSRADVLRQFMVAPTDMTMQMHMVGLMYAPHDKLTLSTMVPYVHMAMNHETRMGQNFRTTSDGFGDIKTAALIPVLQTEHHEVIAKAGVSFPTGSIDQRDDTPARNNAKLPYPMQIGSGTWDLQPGLTYKGKAGNWSWGLQSGGTIRLGKNSNDYRLGNRVFITPWLARKWTDWLSTSVRVNGQAWGNITGRDKELNPRLVQTAAPDLQKGRRLDLMFGVNLLKPRGKLKNHRLAVELGFPLYQHLTGPQLETDFILSAGWQWAF